jgi:hypothetical protein
MRSEELIPHGGRRPNIMINTNKSRRWITPLGALNSLFWMFFWGYFFLHSSPEVRPAAWEQDSFFLVFRRGFGNVATGAFRSWFIESALLLHMPCVLVTWPLTQLFGDIYIAGTNLAGLRLILITLLSYGQWYGIGKIAAMVRKRWKGPAPSPVQLDKIAGTPTTPTTH